MSIRPIVRNCHPGNFCSRFATQTATRIRLASKLATAFALTWMILSFGALDSDRAFGEELTSGTSGRQFKEQAINSIPYNQLNAETKQKISEVLHKTSIYRRLPISEIGMDAEYMKFLVRYPEVIVNIWQLMGVTKMNTERTSPFRLRTDDGVGTISEVDLVYGTDNMHIYYGTGSYEGQVIKKKLTGRCVLILRTEYKQGPDGKPTAVNQLDVFLKVDNATAGLVAKTLNPIVGKTADHNFIESLAFLEKLNETTSKNGPGVQQMAGRLTDISTDVRKQFINVAGNVYKRARGGQVAPAGPMNGQATASASSQPLDSSYAQQYSQPRPLSMQTQQPGAPPYARSFQGQAYNPTRSGYGPRTENVPAGYTPAYRGQATPAGYAPTQSTLPQTGGRMNSGQSGMGNPSGPNQYGPNPYGGNPYSIHPSMLQRQYGPSNQGAQQPKFGMQYNDQGQNPAAYHRQTGYGQTPGLPGAMNTGYQAPQYPSQSANPMQSMTMPLEMQRQQQMQYQQQMQQRR